MKAITFNKPVDVQGRAGTLANCSGVGKVTLRFEPFGDRRVLVDCTVPETELPAYLRDAVIKGIEDYNSSSTIPLRNVSVTIVGAVVHPIDRQTHIFHAAARDAIEKAVAEFGVFV